MRNRNFLIIIIALLSCPFLSAQEKEKTLEECIKEAMQNNLSIGIRNISIKRAKEIEKTAFDIENTYFSLTQDATSGGGMDNSLVVSQSFKFPTYYFTQKKLLKSQTKLENNYLEISKNELIRDVTNTYYQLIYYKEKITILHENDSLYKRFVVIANAKQKIGEIRQLESMNAERLLKGNDIQLKNAINTYSNFQYILQQLMNVDYIVNVKDNNLILFDNKMLNNSLDSNNSSIIQMYEQNIIINKNKLNVIKQSLMPNISLGLNNQLLIKGFNPYNLQRERFNKGDIIGFQVGLSMPLAFINNKRKINAAKKDIEMTIMETKLEKQSLNAMYISYKNDYLKAKNNLDYYSTQGIKQADEILRISNISYENGEIDYIEYMQNMQTVLNIKMQYLESKNDYNKAIIMLNYLKTNK